MEIPSLSATTLTAPRAIRGDEPSVPARSTPPVQRHDDSAVRGKDDSAGARQVDTEQAAHAPARAALGRVRFEMQDHTRVAKYFDTRDVLIYQVPPAGHLYLVKIQENTSRHRVDTAA
ncbi:MAG TPA: hypothetical protein PKH69_00715 [Thiobacillaceae bacterium]|nr:hypothetical protein [Thiobacillaceae bacterium]HNU63364.1 hypothetical protein [Thiobacillaceae bacterium]